MKRIIPSVTVMLWFTFTATAFAIPAVQVKEPVFNFGTISEGKKVDHVFQLTNEGDSPVTILQVTSSCGCTAATISSKTIQPNGTGEIKSTFNSTNFNGNINKTISVQTNDPKTPTVTLTMKGTVTTTVQLNPRQLNFGQVKVEAPTTLALNIANRGQKPLKITGVKTPMPQVTLDTEKFVLKPGEQTKILVTITPRAEDRILSGYLTINTDNPDKAELTVPIYGSPAR